MAKISWGLIYKDTLYGMQGDKWVKQWPINKNTINIPSELSGRNLVLAGANEAPKQLIENGQASTTQPSINMVDSFKYYKGTVPHVKAAKLLDKYLTDEEKNEFAEQYREKEPEKEPSGEIYLYCNWSGEYDGYGLKKFNLYLMNGDKIVDKIVVCSGQSYAQDVVWPEDDYSGSMRPCPEGVYDLGAIDDLGYDPGASDGYGQWVIPLEPRYNNNRSLIRGHSDRNRTTSPGSAGCVCPWDKEGMSRWASWQRSKNAPKYLVMDHGLGYLSSKGVKVPNLGK